MVVEREFTTAFDYADSTDVEIFQGDNELCSNNFGLGGFELKGIQKAKAGVPKIKVTFKLN